MDKGDRVRITGGRQGKDKTGTIFWKGPNKYGSGDRFGVRGDDGETYWVSSDHVESSDAKAPPVDSGPTFEKGDRVVYSVRGVEGTGEVFWIGESRNGPGQRLGVRPEDSDEAVWVDARQCRAATDDDKPAPRLVTADPTWDPVSQGDDDDGMTFAEQLGLDEMPPGPPVDDAMADQWVDEDEEPPPADW